jgi:predicted dehydrogenase
MTRRHFLATGAAAALATQLPAAEPKLRVAIIGHTGKGDYGHGVHTMWLTLPETEIAGVSDPDPKGLEGALAKLKVSAGFADYRELLAKTKPDLVAICPRQVGEHRELALAAADSGAKGIYMEKPFCRTLGEADEIIAACEKSGVKLALAHRNRYQPTLPVIARMLQEGALGRLLEVRARGKEDARGGCVDLWVLGSHVLNVALVFTGAPLACSGSLLKDGQPATPADVVAGAEDLGPVAGNAVHARFDTASGVPIFFDSIANAGDKAAGFGLQLIGTKGIIDFRIDSTPIAHLVPGNPFQPAKDPRPWIPITTAGPGAPEPIADLKTEVSNHQLAGRDLIAAIREHRQPLCSAADARLTVEMITAIFASHVKGGAQVPFPLAEKANPLGAWK